MDRKRSVMNDAKIRKIGNSANVKSFKDLDKNVQELLTEAAKAYNRAYCPYSNFKVGAAVRCMDGSLYRGCNVENASYSLSVCGEKSAIVNAVSDGKIKFSSIAVVAEQEDSFTTPCGACRQFISEFGPKIKIYISQPKLDTVMITSIDELLPFAFAPVVDD